MSGISDAIELHHTHVWHYDGQTVSGDLIYRCDAHTPPLVNIVTANVVGPWKESHTSVTV